MARLNDDILLTILSLVDDNPTLKACHASGKVFREPCQKRIFSSVHLSLGTGQDQRRLNLLDILSTSSLLPTLVKRVRMDGTEDLASIRESNHLATLLQAFTHVEEVYFRLNDGPMLDWFNLPASLQNALRVLFDASSLVSLTLAGVFALPSPVLMKTLGRNVRSLVLERCSICWISCDIYRPVPGSSGVGEDIEFLGIHQCFGLDDILAALIASSRLEMLRTLDIQINSYDPTPEEISGMTLFLNNKHCQYVHNFTFLGGIGPILDFQNFNNLATMTIGFVKDPATVLPWLCGSLETIPANNRIRNISLEFQLPEIPEDPSPCAEWADLDAQLTSEKICRSTVRLFIPSEDGVTLPVGLDFWETRTPKLVASGRLA